MINETKITDIKVIKNNLRVKQISQAHDHCHNYRLENRKESRSFHKDTIDIET